MNIDDHEAFQSDYLKKEDLPQPTILTIKSVVTEEVGAENPEPKPVIYFQEVEKALVLNTTNKEEIKTISGSSETDNWVGKKIVLYVDSKVMFAGKTIGGIRVKAPEPTQPAQPAIPTIPSPATPTIPPETKGASQNAGGTAEGSNAPAATPTTDINTLDKNLNLVLNKLKNKSRQHNIEDFIAAIKNAGLTESQTETFFEEISREGRIYQPTPVTVQFI